MRILLLSVAAVAAALVALIIVADEREESVTARTEAQREQRPAGLEDHLRALQRIADRNDGNRAAGTRGYEESVAYVSDTLRSAGYTVQRQTLRFPFFEERGRPVVSVGGRRLGRGDVRTLIYSGSGSLAARVRGVSGDGCAAGDYDAVRRGEIALVPRRPCTLRRKATLAQRAGAAAVLIVNQTNDTIPGTLGSPGIRIPALFLASEAGEGLDGRRAEVRARTTSERRETTNVLAESRDGEAGGPVTMAGGHLDSVEDGPGLNDNGSGVAALLDTAQRLAGEGRRLRFAFWGAEELGLYGSRHYVRELSRAERRDIRAYVNLDMVGSPNPIRAVYDTDDFVERALREGLRSATDRPLVERDIGRASDHGPFEAANIRVGGLYTGASERKSASQARSQGGRAGRALDPCYHRACDRLRNVNQDVLGEMARAVRSALVQISRR